MPTTDQVVRVMTRHPERMIDRLDPDLFADGYCECRCGPEHHKFWYDDLGTGEMIVACRYHKRDCRRFSAEQVRALAERLMP
jgi:hypothetical protein